MWAFREKKTGKWLYSLTEKRAKVSETRFIAFAKKESAVIWFWGTNLKKQDYELLHIKPAVIEEVE